MNWPPRKAWTKLKPIDGLSHFVAANYGGLKKKRWIIMMSVLDGNVFLKVDWVEITNCSLWIQGWQKDQINYRNDLNLNCRKVEKDVDSQFWIYPSRDSGLINPSNHEIRQW